MGQSRLSSIGGLVQGLVSIPIAAVTAIWPFPVGVYQLGRRADQADVYPIASSQREAQGPSIPQRLGWIVKLSLTVGVDTVSETMACYLTWAGRAGARPNHSITGHWGLVAPDRSNLIKALNVPSYAHCERGLGDLAA